MVVGTATLHAFNAMKMTDTEDGLETFKKCSKHRISHSKDEM